MVILVLRRVVRGTLICVFCVSQAPHLGGLVLFLVFIQFAAAVWYSLSYIPYGRKILTGMCKKVCGSPME